MIKHFFEVIFGKKKPAKVDGLVAVFKQAHTDLLNAIDEHEARIKERKQTFDEIIEACEVEKKRIQTKADEAKEHAVTLADNATETVLDDIVESEEQVREAQEWLTLIPTLKK